ncbi:unnamed protein product [Linum tenue]|uniref:DUF3615 domain-containing protein n=1 Tax=Linum tenue TaxID=586396 RepID=A0AAV0IUR5_9ROSI|nr:unnamed protein product [Linum tenue]
MEGQAVDVPVSPKRQKMEEAAPSSSSSSALNLAAVVSSDDTLPAASAEKEAAAGDQPAAAASLCPAAVSGDKKPLPYIDEGPDYHDPEEHDKMLRDTTVIANISLNFYNEKEGTSYALVAPLLSWCNLFPDGLVIHANFKAKNVTGGPSAGENNPPIELFFSETRKGYGTPPEVRHCLILDETRSDIRRGCAHCPSYVVDESFYHPPVGGCEFGDSEAKDYAKYQLAGRSGSGSGSDTE